MRSIVAAALLFIVTACGERGTAPKPVIPTPVASVTIDPVNTSLEAGQQAVIEASQQAGAFRQLRITLGELELESD